MAVQAMARAGFDPMALVSYLQRVQPSSAFPDSLLPTRDERVSAMKQVIERLPASKYPETRSEFPDIQVRILPLVKGPQSAGPPALRRD